jgi:hypothetical protein
MTNTSIIRCNQGSVQQEWLCLEVAVVIWTIWVAQQALAVEEPEMKARNTTRCSNYRRQITLPSPSSAAFLIGDKI